MKIFTSYPSWSAIFVIVLMFSKKKRFCHKYNQVFLSIKPLQKGDKKANSNCVRSKKVIEFRSTKQPRIRIGSTEYDFRSISFQNCFLFISNFRILTKKTMKIFEPKKVCQIADKTKTLISCKE